MLGLRVKSRVGERLFVCLFEITDGSGWMCLAPHNINFTVKFGCKCKLSTFCVMFQGEAAAVSENRVSVVMGEPSSGAGAISQPAV